LWIFEDSDQPFKVPTTNCDDFLGKGLSGATYKFEVVSELVISDLRPDSPAHQAGLKVGDVVLSINNRNLS